MIKIQHGCAYFSPIINYNCRIENEVLLNERCTFLIFKFYILIFFFNNCGCIYPDNVEKDEVIMLKFQVNWDVFI